jgi:hypothetical protein
MFLCLRDESPLSIPSRAISFRGRANAARHEIDGEKIMADLMKTPTYVVAWSLPFIPKGVDVGAERHHDQQRSNRERHNDGRRGVELR